MRVFQRNLLGGAAALALLTAGGTAYAADVNFNIAPQSLASALNQFGAQSDTAVLVRPELAGSKTTKGISGSASAEVALNTLLQGTGLTWRRDGDTFLIEAADPQSGSAAGDGADAGTVQALIVTAQKKEEAIQDVPIAISAFTEKDLEAQKLEGGFDLLKAIPNVTFSKNNFSGYNFSIRGIGTKAISVATDPGVAVSFNNVTLIRNRLFEQEYFDVERVEVLRGPQGTLYGRNATSGVINVVSAKPTGHFEAMIKAEVGNYSSRRVSGMINVPLVGDKLDLRLAGAWTKRDGYDFNIGTNRPVDGRNLWSGRLTVGFHPVERLNANVVWEHFEEDDDRARTGKQLCTRDYGPESVGGVATATSGQFPVSTRGVLSQGCLPGSLYDAKAFGVPNGFSIPAVFYLGTGPSVYGGNIIKPETDPYAGVEQSHDLRKFVSQLDPIYTAKADVFELNIDFDVTPSLKLSSQTAYNRDHLYSTQDFNRFTTQHGIFANSTPPPECNCASPFDPLLPGGFYYDPQLGKADSVVGQDVSQARSRQFTQEFRLSSAFEGRFNFNVGATYTRYQTLEDYYVFLNVVNILANINNGLGGANFPGVTPPCDQNLICVPIDNNPLSSITGQGHNYFRSQNPYRVNSKGVFGEIYWQASDEVKITAGLRYTDDRKRFTPIPSETLLTDATVAMRDFPDILTSGFGNLFGMAGPGYPALPDINQQWKKFSGRLGVDWKPMLSFTDQTLVYAFYSRGYKGGGANPPGIGRLPPPEGYTFRPEFVNAFELGSKNTLLGGSLILNGDAFFYDYKDYQVSKIVDRSAANENFDAHIWGLEFESIWQPTRNLRFNLSLGYLDTSLGKGSKSIDLMDRTQGHADWVVVKPSILSTSNCIVPAADIAILLEQGAVTYEAPDFCEGGGLTGDYASVNALYGTTYVPAEHPEANFGKGFYADVSGHELPNSPHWTQSVGAQYTLPLGRGWSATLRGDFYHQSQSWARVYQDPIDKLHGWKNGNLSLWAENEDLNLKIEVYAKNIFNDTPITDTFLNSDDTALTTNIFVLDPRLIGLSVRKGF